MKTNPHQVTQTLVRYLDGTLPDIAAPTVTISSEGNTAYLREIRHIFCEIVELWTMGRKSDRDVNVYLSVINNCFISNSVILMFSYRHLPKV